MPNRWLLYDGGCSICAALAREVETRSGGRLWVRSLRDPEVRALLDRAHPGWRWEPRLLEIEGERVRIFTGLALRARLVQILGPARALRVARAVICGVQMASPSRMQPLLLSFLILLTMLLTSHNASAYSVCCKWSTNYATYRYGYLPMAFWDPTDRGASAWTSVPTTSWRYITSNIADHPITSSGEDGMGQEMLSQSQSSQDTEIRSNRSGFDMIKMKTGIQGQELLQATNMMLGQ